MINDAVAHALRIDGYIKRYGLETVEHLMDIGFALDRHIDPHKGLCTTNSTPCSQSRGEGTPFLSPMTICLPRFPVRVSPMSSKVKASPYV